MKQWTCDIGHLKGTLRTPRRREQQFEYEEARYWHEVSLHFWGGKGILMLTCRVSWSRLVGPILRIPASISGWIWSFSHHMFKLQIIPEGYLNCRIHLFLNYQIWIKKWKHIQISWQEKKHPAHRSLIPSFTALKVSMMISPRANLACPLMSAAREV